MVSTEIKNCGSGSLIKVLPNSWIKINKNCEIEAGICHNTTQRYVSISDNTVVYQGQIKIFNFTTNLKNHSKNQKYQSQELVKTVMIISGVRSPDKNKIGIQCYNSTLLKFENSEKTIRLLTMTTNGGEVFRIVDKTTFENGKSCIEAKLVAKKY